jgi:hypothetical protein
MRVARSRIFHRHDGLAAVLAIAAVLLRCIIAPGLMLDPMAAAQGELKLLICTSAGAKSIGSASDQGRLPGQPDDSGLCSFAATGLAGAPVDAVLVGGERHQRGFDAPAHDAAHPTARMRSFAARAPPKFS